MVGKAEEGSIAVGTNAARPVGQVLIRPTVGRGTFDAEGQEGGKYHSRVLSVPNNRSGLTIGRGYDMKEKSASKIIRDLESAGVDSKTAKLISSASGKKGESARLVITQNHLEKFEITQQQQVDLFKLSYEEEMQEVRRICAKADTVAAYGPVEWQTLDQSIKDIMVDLKFRGEYTPHLRKSMQKYVSQNDVDGVYKVMRDRSNFSSNFNQERFDMRVGILKKVVEKRNATLAVQKDRLVGS